MQDDVLYETLTVRETLLTAGLLRLPRHMSRADKLRRVEGLLQVLGLGKSQDTLIGGFFRRGISGMCILLDHCCECLHAVHWLLHTAAAPHYPDDTHRMHTGSLFCHALDGASRAAPV